MTAGALLHIRFTGADLPMLRLRVGTAAAAAGLAEARCDELVLAVYELACNAIVHGGGAGYLLLTRSDDAVRCRVSDDGPGFGEADVRRSGGLWLAGQLTDGVEVDDGALGGAVVTLTVGCRSDRRQLSD